MQHNAHPDYRPDIDGLRAVAVLVVLFYHAFPTLLPSGFIGVDLFFVISGYLISGIIFRSLTRGGFSFADFYIRRVRRIFPALLTVTTATLLAGWVLTFPDEWKDILFSARQALVFVLNFSLMQNLDYFAAMAETRPLLHLWSLCIEEQYYLLWPLLLFVAWRIKPRFVPHMIVALLLLSLAANFILVLPRPNWAFYLPITRFWELLAGSLLAWRHVCAPNIRRFSPAFLSYSGVALLLAGVTLITPQSHWPGVLALLPVTGTILLLAAGSGALPNWLLARDPLVAIGKISYALYLWHWPLLAYAHLIKGPDLSITLSCTLLLTSCLLAFLTTRLIEKPLRFSLQTRKAVTGLLLVWLLLLGAICLLPQTPRLQTPANAQILSALGDWNYPGSLNFRQKENFRFLEMNSIGKRTILFAGESHLEQYWPRVDRVLRDRKDAPRVLFATHGGCPPLPHLNRIERGFHCDKFYDFLLQTAQGPDVDTVVFGAFWEAYLGKAFGLTRRDVAVFDTHDNTRRTLTFDDAATQKIFADWQSDLYELRRQHKKIYIILSNPSSPAYDPKQMIDRISGKKITTHIDRAAYLQHIKPVRDHIIAIAKASGAIIIDPVPLLCDRKTCTTTEKDGTPIQRDSDHLRPFKAREAAFIDRALNL